MEAQRAIRAGPLAKAVATGAVHGTPTAEGEGTVKALAEAVTARWHSSTARCRGGTGR